MHSRRFTVRAACFGLALLAVMPCSRAHAQPKPEAVDYDAPDPERGALEYSRAAANLAFLNWAIWQVDWARDRKWINVTADSWQRNLESGLAFDEDRLRENFLGHPYHGGLQFNSARAAGLNFWESLLYNVAGSLSWEFFAEREQPSTNDLLATTLGGMMVGEISYRLSSALLDDTRTGGARALGELGAAVVDPMRGFNRVYTGDMFRPGAPPRRQPLELELEFGLDRVRAAQQDGHLDAKTPAPLLAVDIDYGDLLPARDETTLKPFQFFELYAALNLFNSELRGAQVYSTGLLWGTSSDLSRDPGRLRDNNVFGFGSTYEYVGVNFANYGAVGLGAADYVVLRFGTGRQLRAGAGFDIVPILGATSTVRSEDLRTYNFSTGIAPWLTTKLGMGRFGELGFRTRHYVTTVIDGEAGDEIVGLMRLWYEIDLLPHLGAGVAPTLTYRRGYYRDHSDYSAQQLSTQFYISVKP